MCLLKIKLGLPVDQVFIKAIRDNCLADVS